MKSQWMLILGLLFALIIAIFAVINVEPVQVNFMFASMNTPLILVILASTLFGGLSVGSIGMFRVFVLQRKVKQLEKKITEYESEQAITEQFEPYENQEATQHSTSTADEEPSPTTDK